jgi:hypothetical protein
MKITMPENLATPFAMLMKGVPEALQTDPNFRDAVLVYLKFGGVTMARRFIETKTNYLNYDPLEIDTGFRFPRLQEAEAEEGADDDDDEEDGDETSDDDDDDDL